MKTKLSFLAFALCLGVALTFALSACDSGGGGSKSETSSSSKGGGDDKFSSARESEQIGKSGFDFYVNTGSDKVELSGIFTGSPADHILKLEFSPSGWVKYDGQVRTSVINLDAVSINLSNKDTEVDLKNSDIDCGARKVKVTACAAKIGNEENCSEHIYEFEKPASYCASSSSANIASSSSVMWRFGSKEGPISVSENATKDIGSMRITLKEQEVNGTTECNASVSGGNIRYTNVNFNINFDDEGYPESNKQYPNSIFSRMESPSTSMLVDLAEYYLLVPSSGDKYLVRIEGSTPSEWPKKIYYWKVEEGPNL